MDVTRNVTRNVILDNAKCRLNVTLTRSASILSSPCRFARHSHVGTKCNDMNVMVRDSGDVSDQAFASASRDAAGRRPGDVRLRRRLAELGSITGLRFSLGQEAAR
ncbi:MAG TPA: hypothetical protein VNG12_16525 [Acidimicrobiales bacterium]|nr:hypothetical protein [Acidimicrobiales bacterium]